MEVKNQDPTWLNETHPNYVRWKRARGLSIERGKFVHSLINKNTETINLSILDLGSGEGGTTTVFSENNFVVSFDLSLVRLKRQYISVISKEGSCLTEKSSTTNKERFLSSSEMTQTIAKIFNTGKRKRTATSFCKLFF